MGPEKGEDGVSTHGVADRAAQSNIFPHLRKSLTGAVKAG